MSADWNKIKTEYITTDISYRKLAEKYGLRYATLQARATNEGWVSQRDQYRAETVSKAVDEIGVKQVDRLSRIENITDKLLDKIEQAVGELDLKIVSKKVKVDDGIRETTTEYREAEEGGIVDRAGLRQITAALKDLKEIQKIKLDRDEQDARIQNLRRQAEDEGDDDEIQVVITGRAKEYAK